MTANWKGEDELKTVFCLSLGRAGTLELYFPFFFLPSSFLPPPLPSLTPAVSPSLPPSLSETTSKWSPLANQPAAKICTTAFLFSLCLRACVIFQVFERVCPSWTFWVDPTQSNTHAHTPTLTAIKLQAEWFSRTPYTRLGGRKRCALVVVVCVCVCRVHPQTGKPPIVPAVSSMFQTCCGISALHGDLLRGGIWKCNVSTAQSLFNNSAFKWF